MLPVGPRVSTDPCQVIGAVNATRIGSSSLGSNPPSGSHACRVHEARSSDDRRGGGPRPALAGSDSDRRAMTSSQPRTTHPVHDPSELSGVYDAWHESLQAEDLGESPWQQLVRRHIGTLEGADVLEIGCGRGGLAAWLVQRNPRMYLAADFSGSAVSAASRNESARRAAFVEADIQRLPHPDSSFDLVVSCETVEHVSEPSAAIRELSRVLRPGGRLFLTTPNYLSTLGLYRAYLRVRGRPFSEEGQPVNNLTWVPRTMSWVRSAGLRPQLVDSCGHYVLLPRRNPIPMRFLDGPRPVLKWLAQHQLIVAEKAHSHRR